MRRATAIAHCAECGVPMILRSPTQRYCRVCGERRRHTNAINRGRRREREMRRREGDMPWRCTICCGIGQGPICPQGHHRAAMPEHSPLGPGVWRRRTPHKEA
jgi:hypothetical protein